MTRSGTHYKWAFEDGRWVVCRNLVRKLVEPSLSTFLRSSISAIVSRLRGHTTALTELSARLRITLIWNTRTMS